MHYFCLALLNSFFITKYKETKTQRNNLRWKIAQAFEIRWWQHYLKGRSEAEYLDWKRQYWTDFLANNQIETSAGQRVLDAGCGPAGIFIVLANQKVDAVDPLLDQYERKLPHFQPTNYPWVDFHHAAFEDFEIKKRYDQVFCLNAINHVADLEKCFDLLVDACEPGGTLIVSIDAHNHQVFKNVFRLIPGDILHPHQYDLEEYQEMLTQRNCELLQTNLYKREFFFNYYVLIAKKSG